VRAAEWKRAAGIVADVLPEYRAMRFGLVKTDEWVASCFYVQTSAFSASAFYVEAFALPRFIPTKHLYFNYGFRVNGRWEEVGSELADAVAAAEPELAEQATLTGLRAATDGREEDINRTEVRLCVAAIVRDDDLFSEARRTVCEFEPEVEWEADVRDRCVGLLRIFDAGGYASLEQEFARYRDEVDRLFA
jgi:hypothetical protein